MSKKIHTEAVDHLFEAVLCLENKEECYTFFEDVCTINELLSLSQRFEVARMLRQKKTYLEISEKTVKKHLGNVFDKLGVENRNAATLLALEKLSEPPDPRAR